MCSKSLYHRPDLSAILFWWKIWKKFWNRLRIAMRLTILVIEGWDFSKIGQNTDFDQCFMIFSAMNVILSVVIDYCHWFWWHMFMQGYILPQRHSFCIFGSFSYVSDLPHLEDMVNIHRSFNSWVTHEYDTLNER